ncbi:hypothetical protein DXG03_008009, partial [Asterophora parasitica]
VYESCSKAMSDKQDYGDKDKRAVIVGSIEKKDPKEGLAEDQKMVEALVNYSDDADVKKAFHDGLITYHRHPKDRAPGKRPLKIELPSKSLRDSLLSGIRSKPGRTPLPSGSFIRRDLTPLQLQMERSAREDAISKNLVAGQLAYGVRDYSIHLYRTPRPLPPNYGQHRTAPPLSSAADVSSSVASTPASASSTLSMPPPSQSQSGALVNHVTTRRGAGGQPR